jgi:hypothetical protein
VVHTRVLAAVVSKNMSMSAVLRRVVLTITALGQHAKRAGSSSARNCIIRITDMAYIVYCFFAEQAVRCSAKNIL